MDPLSAPTDNSTRIAPSHSTRHAIAGCVSLAAFCVALIAGRFADNPTPTILERSLIAMIVAFPLGHLIGFICEFTIRHELITYVRRRPVPDSDQSPDELIETLRAERTAVPSGEAREEKREEK